MNSWGIRGKDPALVLAVQKAVTVAPYDVPVLITGENGTGKEVFHKILHEYSRRRHGKCLAINCGGLPEDTITSELFGHVKGAYTGSVSDRKGYFEEADGGTLFLDEVGDLPLGVQAKLLRVLENGEIIRMGSSEVRKVDVRIVAATNVNLPQAIRDGKFRMDLFYRLSSVSIHIPALRERKGDINLLFRYFASEISKKYAMPDRIQLDDESRLFLEGYNWPGNIRQLRHLVEELSITELEERVISREVLKRHLNDNSSTSLAGCSDGIKQGELQPLWMMIVELKRELDEVRARLGLNKETAKATPALLPGANPAAGNVISSPGHVIEDVPLPTTLATPSSPVITGLRPDPQIEELEVEELNIASAQSHQRTPARTLKDIERQAIAEALQRNNGNKRRASEELDISERTIHRKIQEYDLE